MKIWFSITLVVILLMVSAVVGWSADGSVAFTDSSGNTVTQYLKD